MALAMRAGDDGDSDGDDEDRDDDDGDSDDDEGGGDDEDDDDALPAAVAVPRRHAPARDGDGATRGQRRCLR